MGIKDCYLKIKKYLGSKSGFSERGFLDYLIEKIAQSDSSKPFFINAPTGYGKTAISETIALDEYENGYKTIISYPLRSLIEDQTRKVRELMKNVGVGEEIVGLRYMGRQDSPYLVHPVTLTTIDTLSLTALGISPEDSQKVFREVMGTSYGSLGHYLFSLASVYTSTMILDEVHLLYSTRAISGFPQGIKTYRLYEHEKADKWVVGFTGRVGFSLPDDLFNKKLAADLDALFKFVQFSNVGGGRTAGLGMVEYLPFEYA